VGAELPGHDGDRGEVAGGVVQVDVPHAAHRLPVVAAHRRPGQRLQTATPRPVGGRVHRSLPQAITTWESTDRARTGATGAGSARPAGRAERRWRAPPTLGPGPVARPPPTGPQTATPWPTDPCPPPNR